MSYIGREPQVGNFQVCDAISVVNGQAAYTMQVGGVNVSPETANHMLVSLNGILQAPTTSYTVSGSTITFASNLVTGDVINFIHILGSVLDLGTPSDDTVATSSLKANSVTAAKLNADIISGTTALASEPADTDEFLVSDAGVLKRIDYSLIKGGGTHVLLNTTTVSSAVAQIDFTSVFNSTYKNYMLSFNDARSANDNEQIQLRVFSAIGSPDTGGSQYRYVLRGHRDDDTDIGANSAASSYMQITRQHSGNQTVESQNGRLFFFNPSGTVARKHIQSYTSGLDANERSGFSMGVGIYTEAVAYTGIRLYYGSGNIVAGVFKLYGIN